MLRKDDPASRSGRCGYRGALSERRRPKLFEKWFMQKIPPKRAESERADRSGAEEGISKPSDSPTLTPTRCEEFPAHAMAQPLHEPWRNESRGRMAAGSCMQFRPILQALEVIQERRHE